MFLDCADINDKSNKNALLKSMKGHILQYGSLMGKFKMYERENYMRHL
jgi:phosphatidylethanolamine-binding protein (PEBP) family uncharacterized protein